MRNAAALMFALPLVIATAWPATRVLALGTSDANAHQYVSPWRTPWTYEGPRGSDHWAELDSQYAACSGKEQSPIDIQDTQKANPLDLVPLKRGYYTYLGSQTAPPCNEGVTWFVLKTTMPVIR